MIKISVKGPSTNDLLKAATAAIEKDLADKEAWASLASCLLLAVKLYRKDRKRLLCL